jgi:hypothetical protein
VIRTNFIQSLIICARSTSVLTPVTVRNSGIKHLEFVALDNPADSFKLEPEKSKHLLPGDYRVQVDFTNPPIVIVIAKILYDRTKKRFHIQAEDGLDGARFVTSVDLETISKHDHHHHHHAAEA